MIPRAIILSILAAATACAEQDQPRHRGSREPEQSSTCNDIPSHPLDVILGRPTTRSIVASVMSATDQEGDVWFRPSDDPRGVQSVRARFPAGKAVEIKLTGLKPDTGYVYEVRFGNRKAADGSFHTARPAGSSFVFTITADSHLDSHTDPAIYQRTLARAASARPDFHIDLGDTFMSEKHKDHAEALRQYVSQRYYLNPLCSRAPLFFVLGNHDGENPQVRKNGAEELALWANQTRKSFFPNPLPDEFYTGDSFRHPQLGLLQDYYAWSWGDARFLVLDPFWFCRERHGKGDSWSRSLGGEQYQWLRAELAKAHEKHIFVFIHHLVGGADEQSRGGAEASDKFEWGGNNADGSDGFQTNRPGWPAPIHNLLAKAGVSIVFHGHDHFYARQERGGVIYQESPQPGYEGNGRAPAPAADYGYKSGRILGSSGHLRVAVSPQSAHIEYVKPDGSVADSYSVPSRPHP